ncbi:type VI secretion system tip protein VgrG, partial [Enterobacter mori]
EPETESGAFYARIHHERELNASARIRLESNAACLLPGQVLEPQGEVIRALKEGVVITEVKYHAARDTRLHVSVEGMPYTERYCFRPAEIPRPEVHGTLPARVESREKNDIYAHLDGHGRYRVRLDFDRDDTEQGFAYLWLRMAKPYAGETYGWHTPLPDGTEVAIAYSNGDIDLPYTFEVESGYAGLSFVLPYAFERMFPYEYALAQRFSGVMVDSIGTLEGGAAVIGLKGACWYTILGKPWLEKLGGEDAVSRRLVKTPEISLHSYNNGVILKAGELPPGLGEIKTEGLPPLLVKVNQIIRPIRYDEPRSLHFYSSYENHQFNKESTMKWYRRFDDASALLE